ncbi:NADP-dependent oxidoreductase [Fodinicurvata fenggangensis]|uniref:NADP-dependent oxidoreductase n=1 Tax=Fodinicurvata fenggangensis TaxID=1121830 RepID=UPI00047EAF84|nr:NADP-dependent oxidoreductase [Fodinicurvata fenggangensis]
MTVTAREIHLKSRPEGLPSRENFELVERPLAAPQEGQILVRNLWMSVDPYMRGRMNDRKSYIPPFQLGEALEGGAIGRVTESRDERFQSGDLVSHFAGWRDQAVVDAAGTRKIDADKVPAQAYLGVLGMPGLTAYAGLTRIAEPKARETIFVSAAAGAVGAVVCQVAKLRGCRVVGSAGSQDKIDWLLQEAGVDAVINYKTVENLQAALAEACPDGIDIYFDNVGGDHLDAALALANEGARFVLCGMIGQYNAGSELPAVHNLFQAVGKRIKLQGMIVRDHFDLLPEFTREMSQWIAGGQITWRETVVEGLENAPEAFIGLFRGDNTGKMLVALDKS